MSSHTCSPLPHPLLLAASVQRGIIKTMGTQAKLTQKASVSCGERPNKEALSSNYWLNQSCGKIKGKVSHYSTSLGGAIATHLEGLGQSGSVQETRGEQQHVGCCSCRHLPIHLPRLLQKQSFRYCFIKNSDCRVRASPPSGAPGTVTMQGHITVNAILPASPQPLRCSQG